MLWLLRRLAERHECCYPVWDSQPHDGYHSAVRVRWWCLHVQGTLGWRLVHGGMHG